jgi:hypothetical protein
MTTKAYAHSSNIEANNDTSLALNYYDLTLNASAALLVGAGCCGACPCGQGSCCQLGRGAHSCDWRLVGRERGRGSWPAAGEGSTGRTFSSRQAMLFVRATASVDRFCHSQLLSINKSVSQCIQSCWISYHSPT